MGYTELTTFRSAAWHAIREDDFSIIDFTYLSPALVDLITLCMRGEPNDRPTMAELAQHPILRRARSSGKDALSPEDELWLPAILANAVIPVQDAFDDSNECVFERETFAVSKKIIAVIFQEVAKILKVISNEGPFPEPSVPVANLVIVTCRVVCGRSI
ncbi:MAG: hypothetical protein EOP09_12650 [Proteobacteria bacterium]|nr:MAG: hypothetical protein EOP09_12650 [Pseudomonadota bacterium]